MDDFEQRLRAVDWRSYHHAYGEADDVPGLLLALRDADRSPKGFEEAAGALWGNVFHQGTRWGVTATTVPFLLELLERGPRSPEARHFLLTYLHHLAVGYPESSFPEPFPIEEASAAAAKVEAAALPTSALRGDIFGDDAAPELAAWQDALLAVWERDSFEAVERGVSTVTAAVQDDEDDVAGAAIALVSTFPRRRAASAPTLWAVANDVQRAGRRGLALVALARLGADGVVEPARVVMDADDGRDGLYAACAEVLASEAPGEVARRRLSGVERHLTEAACPFTGQTSALVSWCVRRAPPSDPALTIDALARMLEQARGFDKLTALSRLIGHAFPAGFQPGQAVSPLQRRALEAAATHALWAASTTFGQQDEVFRRAGLPTARTALHALATGLEP